EGAPGGIVYFAGGRTLYAADAATGKLAWKRVLCGKPDDAQCKGDAADPGLIYTSPVVAGGKVIVGLSVDGADGYRGGLVALDAATGEQAWRLELDPIADAGGIHGAQSRGCGNVWATAAVDIQRGLLFVD